MHSKKMSVCALATVKENHGPALAIMRWEGRVKPDSAVPTVDSI